MPPSQAGGSGSMPSSSWSSVSFQSPFSSASAPARLSSSPLRVGPPRVEVAVGARLMPPPTPRRYRPRGGSPSTPPRAGTRPPSGAEHVPGPRWQSRGGRGVRGWYRKATPDPQGDRPRAYPFPLPPPSRAGRTVACRFLDQTCRHDGLP